MFALQILLQRFEIPTPEYMYSKFLVVLKRKRIVSAPTGSILGEEPSELTSQYVLCSVCQARKTGEVFFELLASDTVHGQYFCINLSASATEIAVTTPNVDKKPWQCQDPFTETPHSKISRAASLILCQPLYR